jgi:hypothetical protein
MHLHGVDAVFELVAFGDDVVGQLSLLAQRHEAGRELVRHRPAQDEAPRLDARDLVDLGAGIGLHQFVHSLPEGARIAHQRGDIPEHDPRLWESPEWCG